MRKFIWCSLLVLALDAACEAQTLGSETVVLESPYGKITIKLYEETPLHKANFIKLINNHFFDSTFFHRVINQFMIQGGDPISKKAAAGDSLGHGDLGYTVPAEFSEKLIHRKGTLCAARESDDINPLMASSASQFYLVMGKKRTLEDLKKYEDRINKNHLTNCRRRILSSEAGKKIMGHNTSGAEAKIDSLALAEHLKTPLYRFNDHQVETYTTVGGTPHLDGTYTVFGEVVEGIEVIDKIAAVKTDSRDRPLEDVRIRMYMLSK